MDVDNTKFATMELASVTQTTKKIIPEIASEVRVLPVHLVHKTISVINTANLKLIDQYLSKVFSVFF